MFQNWGPAFLIVFSILIGIVYGNKRLDDLRSPVNVRFDDINKRFDDINRRFDDLNRYLELRFGRLEERVQKLEERVEHPVIK